MNAKLIGIAGGSCSGKSSLCNLVQNILSPQNCELLSLDSYYHDLSHLSADQQRNYNFDIPAAIDYELLIGHLRLLKTGGSADVPIYDFSTHCRTSDSTFLSGENKIVLVEGLFSLYWTEARRLFTTKFFIDLESDACIKRRIERDVRNRGRTPESVNMQYRETVEPMYDRYIAPTREYADTVFQGDVATSDLADSVIRLVAPDSPRTSNQF